MTLYIEILGIKAQAEYIVGENWCVCNFETKR